MGIYTPYCWLLAAELAVSIFPTARQSPSNWNNGKQKKLPASSFILHHELHRNCLSHAVCKYVVGAETSVKAAKKKKGGGIIWHICKAFAVPLSFVTDYYAQWSNYISLWMHVSVYPEGSVLGYCIDFVHEVWINFSSSAVVLGTGQYCLPEYSIKQFNFET